MGIAMGVIGLIGFAACFVWFLVLLIAKRPKEPAKTGMMICTTIFFVGLLVYLVVDYEPNSNGLDTQVETSDIGK